MYKVSKFKTILFLIFSNLFYFIAVSFDFTLHKVNQNTYYMPIIFLLFYLILIFFIPKDFSKSLKKLHQNKIAKQIVRIFIYIQSLIIIYLSSLFYTSYVNTEIPIIFYLIILLIVFLITGNNSFSSLITLSSIFNFISLLLYLIPIFSNTDRYLEYILPFEFNSNYLILGFVLSFIPIDNILIILYSNQINRGLTKKDLIITGVLYFLLLTYIYTDSLTLISHKIYEDYNLSLFFHWHIYNDNKYISNYDFALLFIMLVSIIFKLSININLLKITSNKNEKNKLIYFIPIISFILYYLKIDIKIILNYANYLLSFLGLIIYIVMQIILRRKINEGIN